METWLQEHALKNVWCNPVLDRRHVIKPRRISSPEGEVCQLRVSEHQVNLPKDGIWYNVYQIGALRPESVGIDDFWSGWVTAQTLLNKYGTIIQVYEEGGRTIPLGLVWLRVLKNRNVILAVENYPNQINFSKTDLYIRFYSGYFKLTPGYTANHRTYSESLVMSSGEVLASYLERYHASLTKPGFTFCYINGYPVKALTADNVNLWDYVEFVHDGSVKEVYDFNVSELPNFNSQLDTTRKLILHPPKTRDEINYLNDIELYVYVGDTGRYYPLHKTADVRQLTHRDYSIPSANLTKYTVGNGVAWANEDNYTLRLVIRRSGFTNSSGVARPLTYENNRIHELYKLNDAGILQAFTGINALVEEWQAANLELSSYVRLMSSNPVNINRKLSTDAYGYNAVSKYVADTPTAVIEEAGVKYVPLPPLLQTNSTAFEYDSNGYLLGFYLNESSDGLTRYTCVNSDTAMVEIIEGRGTDHLDIDFNAFDYVLDPNYDYRFYLQTLKGEAPTDEWVDVTGDYTIYTVDGNGKVIWNIDPKRRRPAIWKDSKFLAYDFVDDGYDGTIRFSANTYRSDQTGKWVMRFIPETLELWINGKSAIQGLDYFVEWPQIVVCNKSYLDFNGDYHAPKITIRARNQASALRKPTYGFVVDGLLSNNDRFDVKDDKVVRIIADGALRHRDQIQYREDVGINLLKSRNGAPYVIDDPLIPLRDIVEYDTYVMRNSAEVIDAKVENYLTVKLPQLPNVTHNPIDDKHILFSPVLNKLVHDLINGILLPEEDVTNFLSTKDLDKLLEPYKYLMDYDPIVNGVDLRYVEVQPHDGLTPVYFKELHYSIIERANELWLDNAVDITKLVKLQVKNG